MPEPKHAVTSRRPRSGADRASGAVFAVLRALAPRPWLWPAGVAEAWRLAPRGWWHRWPPLPVPDGGLWQFRMETAYGGSGDRTPEEHDIVSFVEWSRAMRLWRRR